MTPEARARKWCPHLHDEEGVMSIHTICVCGHIAAAISEVLEEVEKILARHNQVNHRHDREPPRCARHLQAAIAALRGGTGS